MLCTRSDYLCFVQGQIINVLYKVRLFMLCTRSDYKCFVQGQIIYALHL
jgi:hypothetical protein